MQIRCPHGPKGTNFRIISYHRFASFDENNRCIKTVNNRIWHLFLHRMENLICLIKPTLVEGRRWRDINKSRVDVWLWLCSWTPLALSGGLHSWFPRARVLSSLDMENSSAEYIGAGLRSCMYTYALEEVATIKSSAPWNAATVVSFYPS